MPVLEINNTTFVAIIISRFGRKIVNKAKTGNIYYFSSFFSL
jgi:hypothetical protein